MTYILPPTGEDPVGKVLIPGNLFTAVESETQKGIPLPCF
jgi:hypothetical protein